MDAQIFLDNFATTAEAPGGVRRLRDLVLDLAVSGGLVSQKPAEGTGLEVVEQGAAVISDAVTKGWTRQRSVPEPTAEEIPFPIPGNWAWARLPAVTHGLGQLTPDRHFTYLDVSSVNGEDGSLHGTPTVIAPDKAPSRARKAVRPGTVLYSTIRPYLRNVVHIDRDFQPPAIASTAFAVLHPVPGLDPRYLKLCVRSAYFSRFTESRQKGVAYPAINDGDLAFGLVPIPPPAEQERIVAKVDELMGLCDDIEARQERRNRATTRFRSSALHALTAAETSEDLRHAWERVSATWPVATQFAEDVRAFRATVLQLAIEGRLVSRLAREGTADETLRAINDEREKLARDGAIARPRLSVEVTPAEQPFALPSHWKWVRVEDLVTHVVDCLHRTPPYSSAGVPAIRTSDVEPGRVLVDQALLVDEATYREQTRRLVPREGDVLYSREGGRFGIAAVVPANTRLCLSQRMMQFRCAAAVAPDYFSWFLNSPLGFGQAAEDVGGSASPHVNIKSIRRFVVPLPPTGEQVRIVESIHEMLDAVNHLARCLERQTEHAYRFVDSAVSALLPD